MAAMTSFYPEKCCRLVNTHATPQREDEER